MNPRRRRYAPAVTVTALTAILGLAGPATAHPDPARSVPVVTATVPCETTDNPDCPEPPARTFPGGSLVPFDRSQSFRFTPNAYPPGPIVPPHPIRGLDNFRFFPPGPI